LAAGGASLLEAGALSGGRKRRRPTKGDSPEPGGKKIATAGVVAPKMPDNVLAPKVGLASGGPDSSSSSRGGPSAVAPTAHASSSSSSSCGGLLAVVPTADESSSQAAQQIDAAAADSESTQAVAVDGRAALVQDAAARGCRRNKKGVSGIEFARSGRSCCQVCQRAIAKMEIRWLFWASTTRPAGFLHLECVMGAALAPDELLADIDALRVGDPDLVRAVALTRVVLQMCL
jgi:hypothetical protein